MELLKLTDKNSTSPGTVPAPVLLEPEQLMSPRKTKSRVFLNLCLDVLLLAAVLVIALVSAVLHVVFPAPTMADGWILWGLSFNQWRDIQSTALAVCGLLVLEHVVLHWNWVCGTIAARILRLKKRPDEGVQAIYGVGTFIAVLMLICGCLAAATLCVKQPPH